MRKMDGVSTEKIEELVRTYQMLKESGKIESYNEEETKKDFILPLFEALGWEVYSKKEVSAEEHQSGGRVDYGFMLNGRVKFYLEAKALKADLNRSEFAKQAIRYSWNKGITWAILTDFESLKVFNAQVVSENLANKLFFEIRWDTYIDQIDQLNLLSKRAFTEDLLDKQAEKWGKKLPRISVTSSLYKDLNYCREVLTSKLGQQNPKVDQELLDEGVQKLLDRLLFIRVAEDRGVEDKTLIPLLREWQISKTRNEVPLYQSMVKKFRELDKIYDSNLFTPHPFEDWEDYSDATKDVIETLYGKEGYYEYDFKVIPSDVLGTVYENYLGYRLQKSKKGLTVDKDASKRKEQGIYYTPSYIVDFIVDNALKPVLDRCTSIEDLQKIKVLDPACGSGSFLIKALDVIFQKYREFGNLSDEEIIKTQILMQNIYGVDLDPQAVEIARLNLLINSLSEKMQLPSLSKNIKNGNSLISGTDEDLKKYFGPNFRDKKPFNWQDEFPEVFKQGGFDAVIGNPPYIDSEEMTRSGLADVRDYCTDYYGSGKGNWDIFCVFIEKGLNLLRVGGLLSFIVPNKLISANYARHIREIISQNTLRLVRDYSDKAVFGASVYPIVFVISKDKEKINTRIYNSDDELINNVDRTDISSSVSNWASILFKSSNRIVSKIMSTEDVKRLESLALIKGGATVSEAYMFKKIIKERQQELSGEYFKVINSGTIDQYKSLWGIERMRYLGESYLEPIVNSVDLKAQFQTRLTDATSSKLIVSGMGKKLECFFDLKGEYLAAKSTTIIISADTNLLKMVMGLLNSKLLTFIYCEMFKALSLSGGYIRIGPPQLKDLPIILPNQENQKDLINLVDKISNLSKELLSYDIDSEKWIDTRNKIELTDSKIDQLVYDLYGLTKEEVRIVEDLHV